MKSNFRKSLMPTKLRYRMLVGFCLTSLLPLLAGAYLASAFIRTGQEAGYQNYLLTLSLVGLFSISLSLLGFMVIKQVMLPIQDVSAAAQQLADGKMESVPPVSTTTDEIEDLTISLQRISKNAKELLDKVEKLSLKDKITGLHNATYIRERLDEEIQRAIHYQRPCSFSYLLLKNFEEFESRHGKTAGEDALRQVAHILNASLREFDRAARIGRGEFAVIFPDKNKKKCIDIMEKIGAEIGRLAPASGSDSRLLVATGISENPIDGVQADALYMKAQDRMKTAHAGGRLLEAFA